MNTSKFMTQAKKAGMTVAEVGVLTGGALAATKFLDFNTLFKDQIAKDPKFADKWFIKYQAPIKLGAGALAAAYIKNPWLKLAAIGVALNGAIGTVRLATAKADGTNFFTPIGQSELDQKLLQAAGVPITQEAYTNVATPYGYKYPTQVGKPVDLMDYTMSTVGNANMERGVGMVMMERGVGATGCSMNM